jgi:hypothetical protein
VDLRELYEKRDRLQNELDGLKIRYEESRDDGVLNRMNDTKTALVRTREAIVMEASKNPANREPSEPEPAVVVERQGWHSESLIPRQGKPVAVPCGRLRHVRRNSVRLPAIGSMMCSDGTNSVSTQST